MNSKQALKELYNEREYTYGESVNHKSDKWKNDIEHYDNIGSCLLVIKKDLEVLDIIKEKDLDTNWIRYQLEQYNMTYAEYVFSNPVESYHYLTETEFNLIKQWLG